MNWHFIFYFWGVILISGHNSLGCGSELEDFPPHASSSSAIVQTPAKQQLAASLEGISIDAVQEAEKRKILFDLIVDELAKKLGKKCGKQNKALKAEGLKSCGGEYCLVSTVLVDDPDSLQVAVRVDKTDHDFSIRVEIFFTFKSSDKTNLIMCAHPRLTPLIKRVEADLYSQIYF